MDLEQSYNGASNQAHWRQDLSGALLKILVGSESNEPGFSRSSCPMDLTLVLLRLSGYSPDTFRLVQVPLLRKLRYLISMSNEVEYSARVLQELHMALQWWHIRSQGMRRAVHDLHLALQQRYERNALLGSRNLRPHNSPPSHQLHVTAPTTLIAATGGLPAVLGNEWMSFSHSPIWTSSANFYEKNASNSWLRGPVPYVISNSRLHAQNIAAIIVGWIQDNHMAPGDRLVVFDIGAGVCQFGYHLCSCLADAAAMCRGVDVMVVLADVSAPLVYASAAHPAFLPFICNKQVDFVAMHPNGVDFGTCELLIARQRMADFIASSTSIAFTANYLIDSLPTDLFFHTESGCIHEVRTRLQMQQTHKTPNVRSTSLCQAEIPAPSKVLTTPIHSVSSGTEYHNASACSPRPKKVQSLKFAMDPAVLMTVQTCPSSSHASVNVSESTVNDAGKHIYASVPAQQAWERVARMSQKGTGFLMPTGALCLMENMLAAVPPQSSDISVLLIATDKTYTDDMYTDARQPPPGFTRHGDARGEHCHSLAVHMPHLGAALSRPIPTLLTDSDDTASSTARADSGTAHGVYMHAKQASTLFQTSCFVLREGYLAQQQHGLTASGGVSDRIACTGACASSAVQESDGTGNGHSGNSGMSQNIKSEETCDGKTMDAARTCLWYTHEALLLGAGTFGGGDWEMLWTTMEDCLVDDVSKVLQSKDSITVFYRLLVVSCNDYSVFETLMWTLRRALVYHRVPIDTQWLHLIQQSFSRRFLPVPHSYHKQCFRLARWYYSLCQYAHALDCVQFACSCQSPRAAMHVPANAGACKPALVCASVYYSKVPGDNRNLLEKVLLYVSCHMHLGTLPAQCIAGRMGSFLVDKPMHGTPDVPLSGRIHRLVRRIHARLGIAAVMQPNDGFSSNTRVA